MWKRNVQILWKGMALALLLNRSAAAFKSGSNHEEVVNAKSWVDTIPIVSSDGNEEAPRALSVASAKIGTFSRLQCNPVTWSDCTTLVSNNLPSLGEPLIVPCGQCYTFDVMGNATFDGINIVGKLLFSNNHKAVINTPYVIVQGELELSADENISPANQATKFVLTGTQDVIFNPTEAPNQSACGAGCNLGVKPFVVAGGEVKIQGMADSCTTHTPVKRQVYKDPTYDPADFPTFTSLSSSCAISGTQTDYISYDFEDDNVGNWTGREGAFIVVADGSLIVSNRMLHTSGPYLDITPIFPEQCLVADQDYLVVAR